MGERDPSDEIEAAAFQRLKQVEASEQASEQAARAKVIETERAKRAVAEDMIRTSVMPPDGEKQRLFVWLLGSLGFGSALGFGVAFTFFRGQDNLQIATCFSVPLALAALGYIVLRLIERMLASSRRRAVFDIGHGFDGESYLRRLSENRRSGQLVVTVHFARPWEARLALPTPQAVQAWMPELAKAAFTGDDTKTLSIESIKLDTYVSDVGGSKSGAYAYFTNFAVHQTFLRLVKKVLPKLNAGNPIERIDVDIVGQVLPFDADPRA